MDTVQLDHGKLRGVAAELEQRVVQRFPSKEAEPGLKEHVKEVQALLERAPRVRRSIRRPYWMFRLTAIAMGVAVAMVVDKMWQLGMFKFDLRSMPDLIQTLDAAKNLAITLVTIIASLFWAERRLKAFRAVRFLDQLIAEATVVSLAQQSKDPERLLYDEKEGPTAASPSLGATKTAFLLERYLDYCYDLVGLLPTIAAFVTAGVDDARVMNKVFAVNDWTRNINQVIGQKRQILAEMRKEIAVKTP